MTRVKRRNEQTSVPGKGLVAPTLYSEQFGHGPLIVFLPGVGGTTRYWRSRVLPLADSHRIMLIDLLGFGRSPKPWTRYSVERHVTELHRVLDGHGPFIMVGHSFGASLAIAYAARYQASVTRLVLLSVPHFGGEKNALRYFRSKPGAERWVMTHMMPAAAACIVTRRVFVRWMPRLKPDLPREVAEDLVQHTWRSSTSTIWEGVYRHNIADDAARLRRDIPVFMLHGERDTTAPVNGAAQLLLAHPHWTLRLLPGADHHPLLRNPSWCLDAIRSFAASELPGAGR